MNNAYLIIYFIYLDLHNKNLRFSNKSMIYSNFTPVIDEIHCKFEWTVENTRGAFFTAQPSLLAQEDKPAK